MSDADWMWLEHLRAALAAEEPHSRPYWPGIINGLVAILVIVILLVCT